MNDEDTTTRGTAIVTGGAHRIGRAIALGLGQAGWDLVIHCNSSPKAGQGLVDDILGLGRRARLIRQDLANWREAGQLVEAVNDEGWAWPFTLVNNASIFDFDDARQWHPESWERHFAVNTFAPMSLAQALFQAAGPARRGAIINVIDSKVYDLDGAYLSYENSKASLHALTRSQAAGYAPRLRVNAIAPGLTLISGRQTEAEFRRVHGLNPMRQGATPEQIARAVRYFSEADGVTGQVLAIDGGESWAGIDPAVKEGM